MSEKFSLKDHLFNRSGIEKIASQITSVYPSFKSSDFIKTVVEAFPRLELKERISWITENLHRFLPQDYQKVAEILLKSLPPPLDPTLTDNDFGEFIYAPYNHFVATYGLDKKDLAFSLKALRELTMRFSAEDSIRYFINAYQDETMKELAKWASDSNYHVRRLVSEGSRPKLPWSQKIGLQDYQTIPLLDKLYFDTTRYVTRSVANHLNDVSKTNPELVLKTLQRWEAEGKQQEKEMDFIIRHSLRTLVKKGNKDAISFLKFSIEPAVTTGDLVLSSQTVAMGSHLEFSFEVTALTDERLLIDYVIYFQNKAGTQGNKKVFKIKQLQLKKGETITISKRHRLLETMTTRTLYRGAHAVELQINGNTITRKDFELV